MLKLIAIIVLLAIVIIYIRCQKSSFESPGIIPGPVTTMYKRVYAENGQPKIVVGFHYAPWCPHCKMTEPIWDVLARRLAPRGVFMFKHNEDVSPTPNIESIPTIIKYTNGVAEVYTGNRSPEAMEKWIMDAAFKSVSRFPLY